MRNNQPVINEEYQVPKSIHLVSKTDLVGNIIECNDAFEAASGFTRSELIGQPHNIIRHPDVPPVVFEDMWKTLKQGLTWSQLVKNRRKNGGFYWVLAQATPIFANGKPIGYMSVRSSINEEQKKAATQAYKDIASGKARIHYGQVYYGFNWQKFNIFAATKLTILLPSLRLLVYCQSWHPNSWALMSPSNMWVWPFYFSRWFGWDLSKSETMQSSQNNCCISLVATS